MYRIAPGRHITVRPWLGVQTYPTLATADQLIAPGPDQAAELQRLVDLGAIVLVPEE